MNSLDELIKAFELVTPPKPLDIQYRFYYNEKGDITMCSMADHPDGDNYIVVTRSEFDNYFDYRVKDGKLKIIDRSPKFKKLMQGGNQYKVAKHHAAILLDKTDTIDHEYYTDITDD